MSSKQPSSSRLPHPGVEDESGRYRKRRSSSGKRLSNLEDSHQTVGDSEGGNGEVAPSASSLIRPPSCEFVDISPKELYFPVPHHLRSIRNEIMIQNKHTTGYLLFKVKCAWPLQYVAKPSTGFVLPGAAQTLSIKLKPIDMPAALLNEYPRPIADAFSDLITPGKKPSQEEVIKFGEMIPTPLIKTCSKQLNHFFSKEMIRVSVKLIPFTPEMVKQASEVKDFAVTAWEKNAAVPRVLEQRLGLRWAVPQAAVPDDVVLYFSPASTLSTVLTSASRAPKALDGLRKEVSFAAGDSTAAIVTANQQAELRNTSAPTPQVTSLSPPVTATTTMADVFRTTSNTSSSYQKVINDPMLSKRNSTLSIRESETALLAAHSKQSSRRNSSTTSLQSPSLLTKASANKFKGPVESIKHSVEEMNRLYAERNKVAEEIQQLAMKRAHIELEIATATNRTLVVKESHAAVARETGESYEEAAARAEGILHAKRGEHRRRLEEDQSRRLQKEVAVSRMVYLRTALIVMIVMFVVGAVTRKFLL